MSIGANAQAAQLLDSLPPEELSLLPVSQPPAGVIPNFVHPQWRVPEFFGATAPFLLIALIMYGIRVYMKGVVVKKWRIEDTTLMLGFLTAIAYYIIMAWGSVVGPIAKHGYELTIANAISRGGYMVIMCGTFLPIPALGLIKATLFLQYYQLFNPMKWMRVCVIIGLIVTGLFYTAVTVAYIALMAQRPGETFADTMLSEHWAAAYSFFLPPGVVGVLLDWYLLILPIPAVLQLNMSPYKKLGVISIFMTGGLAAIASIVSLYYRSEVGSIIPDASWDVIPVTIFVLVELFCGVMAACMPTVHLFWHRHSKLVKLSAKVKSGMKTVLGINSGSGDSSRRRNPMMDDQQHMMNASPHLGEKEAPDFNLPSDESILVSRIFGVTSATSTSRNDSEATEVGYDPNFKDLEAQKPLPVHKSERYGHF